MAIIACAECGKEVSDQARACPSCGGAPAKPRKKGGIAAPLLGGAALVVVFLVIAGASSGDGASSEKMNARLAIADCWKEQERKSLDAGTRLFMAGTCEMMERRFQERFNQAP